MRRWLAPRLYVPSLAAITAELLDEHGVTGVILDADNTLVPRQKYHLDDERRAWLTDLQAAGKRFCVLSNSFHVGGIQRMVDEFGIPTISVARKPMRQGFRRALAALGTTPAETCIVGDQLLTDILGGNLAGMLTIMVPPLTGRDFIAYAPFRPVERWLLRRWRTERT